jgi:DeoR/GlpR family transcriptional regulator of sugar metabolism
MGRSAKPGIERRKAILKLLRSGASVDTARLAHKLGVSEMTVRRDLKELETRNEVLRNYGGATLARRVHLEFQFDRRQQERIHAKQAIGRHAANLVQPGETIFVDTGTTTLEFARELARRNIEVTVATASLAVGSELWGQEQIRVLILGGQLRGGSPDLTGPICEHSLDLIHANRAFLGCDGLLLDRGLFAADADGASISATMLRNAEWRCLLADSSKIGHPAPVRYATFSELDEVITDDEVPPDVLSRLKDRIKEVHAVKLAGKQSAAG